MGVVGGRRWGKGNKARDKLVELVDTLGGADQGRCDKKGSDSEG